MKKVLFALLAATICFACDKEGKTSDETPVGSAISQFSPEYGQVTRAEKTMPWTIEGELLSESGILLLKISGEYSFARVVLFSESMESEYELKGEPEIKLSTQGHSGQLKVTVLLEDEWECSACFVL